MTKIRLYGLDDKRNVVKTAWMWNSVSDAQIEVVAEIWKTVYGCTRVFAMMDSKELRDAWFDFVRGVHKHDGRDEMAKFEFIDYLESGDWELAKD